MRSSPIRQLALASGLLCASLPAVANHIPIATGNVLVANGSGQMKHFTNTGTLLETIALAGGFETGMCFDSLSNVFATNFSAGTVTKLNSNLGVTAASFVSGLVSPEACLFDTAGNFFVTQVSGPGVRKTNANGATLATFATGRSDWMDLSADQCTLLYTQEGTAVKRFNVCTNSALSDLTAALTAPLYAIRIRPNGEILIGANTQVYRLNSSGGVIQTYQRTAYSETGTLFALNLDPDGTTFWTAGVETGNVRRINIETGAQVSSFASGGDVYGVAVVGEIQVAQPSPTPTVPGPTNTPTSTPTFTPTSSPTAVAVSTAIPTMSPRGLLLFSALLASVGLLLARRVMR